MLLLRVLDSHQVRRHDRRFRQRQLYLMVDCLQISITITTVPPTVIFASVSDSEKYSRFIWMLIPIQQSPTTDLLACFILKWKLNKDSQILVFRRSPLLMMPMQYSFQSSNSKMRNYNGMTLSSLVTSDCDDVSYVPVMHLWFLLVIDIH